MSEHLTPPQGQSANIHKPPTGSAVEHMESMDGRFETELIAVGWAEQSRNPNTQSQDRVMVSQNKHRETYLGVFDGVGGHEGGETAACIAQQAFFDLATSESYAGIQQPLNHVRHLFGQVSRGVIADTEQLGLFEAGTTATMTVLKEGTGENEGRFFLFGGAVGDSLGYIVRGDGTVEPLNKEESLRQDMLDQGVPVAEADKNGNVVTNVIAGGGFYRGLHQEFSTEVYPGDYIVLTTDGITGDRSTERLSGGSSNEAVIARVVRDQSLTAKEKAQRLVDLAVKIDDRTALVVEVPGDKTAPLRLEELRKDMELLREWWHDEALKSGELSHPLKPLKDMAHAAVSSGARVEMLEVPKTRADELFFGYDTKGSEKEFDDKYFDLLMGREVEYIPPNQQTPENLRRQGLEKRFAVTEDSMRDAERVFRGLQRDPIIEQAVLSMKNKHPKITEGDLMGLLRTDTEFRKLVGVRLLKIVRDHPYGVGNYETRKTPNHPGYDGINPTPEEYVALLLLSMADGTFKSADSKSKPVTKRGNSLSDGRSRTAALSILRSITG